MNRTLSTLTSLPVLVLGLGLLVFGMVSADAQSSTSFKVGVVDLQRTLKETKVGKAAKKRLESNKTRKQKELDKKQKDLTKYAAELNKQRAVLKPAVLRKRERELQERYVALQETYMKLQQELAQMEAKLVQEIFAKASPVIQKIGREQNFAIIVEKNEGAVLFANAGLDITDQVNKRVK